VSEPVLVVRARRLRAARGVVVARDVTLDAAPGDVVAVEVSGLGRLENRVVDWDVDLSGPGEQLQVSANTLHVALAMPEDEAEDAVRSGRS